MIVVADTSPINYLLLIGHIDILPRLYQRVIIPTAVAVELSDTEAPALVRSWIENKPDWIEIGEKTNQDISIAFLGRGEQDGIALAQSIGADIILLDDLMARKAAQARNLHVTGTLGVLCRAAENGWVDLQNALEKLQSTNFYIAPSLIARLLEQNRK
jgi:predicted nucleic acid-binding protein